MVALRGFATMFVAAGCLSLASSQVMADERAMYLGFAGGMNVPTTNAEARRDTDQTREEIYEDFDYNLDYGYSLTATAGVYIKDFRIELQCAGQSNEIHDVQSLGVTADVGGRLNAMQFMGNVLYDIPLSKHVTAFLGAGAGAGVAEVWLRPDSYPGGLGNQDGVGFAYQGIAGIAWEIGPGVCMTAQYRVWTATGIEMQDAKLEMPMFHMVEVGVRFSF